MKMITRDHNVQYLETLKVRLEGNGIPAVIQGQNTARMIVPISVFQPTLWIYIDEQFDDAVQLIENPAHIVTSGIDMEAFYNDQPNELEQHDNLNAALIHLALFVGLIMLAIFVFIKILNWLQT